MRHLEKVLLYMYILGVFLLAVTTQEKAFKPDYFRALN